MSHDIAQHDHYDVRRLEGTTVISSFVLRIEHLMYHVPPRNWSKDQKPELRDLFWLSLFGFRRCLFRFETLNDQSSSSSSSNQVDQVNNSGESYLFIRLSSSRYRVDKQRLLQAFFTLPRWTRILLAL
jgi:hypothetical protein